MLPVSYSLKRHLENLAGSRPTDQSASRFRFMPIYGKSCESVWWGSRLDESIPKQGCPIGTIFWNTTLKQTNDHRIFYAPSRRPLTNRLLSPRLKNTMKKQEIQRIVWSVSSVYADHTFGRVHMTRYRPRSRSQCSQLAALESCFVVPIVSLRCSLADQQSTSSSVTFYPKRWVHVWLDVFRLSSLIIPRVFRRSVIIWNGGKDRGQMPVNKQPWWQGRCSPCLSGLST